MANFPRRPVAVDLFAGAGGFSLGIEQAGFDVAVAVEQDPVHGAVYAFNFPHTKVLCTDVATLSGQEIKEALDEWTSNNRQQSHWGSSIDLVFGGPPCQGFSMIGKGDPNDARNNLVFEFCRLVTELQPRYFVMENVPGLVSKKHCSVLKELISRFKAAGYEISEPVQVLNAANFGVPQQRRRLFVLGAQVGAVGLTYPEPELRSPSQYPTVQDAIADLPNPQLLTSSMQTLHTETSIERFKKTPMGLLEPISRLRRLDWEKPCYTLRAGTGYDRGSYTSPRPLHPMYPRVISVREAARLHSFPDWFRFHMTKWHGFRQVGNAVPPLLARVLGSQIIAALEVEPSVPTTPIELGDTELLRFNLSRAAKYWKVPESCV
jgi:DNA (cytosine-5)-methyltransferase 1